MVLGFVRTRREGQRSRGSRSSTTARLTAMTVCLCRGCAGVWVLCRKTSYMFSPARTDRPWAQCFGTLFLWLVKGRRVRSYSKNCKNIVGPPGGGPLRNPPGHGQAASGHPTIRLTHACARIRFARGTYVCEVRSPAVRSRSRARTPGDVWGFEWCSAPRGRRLSSGWTLES